MLSRDLKAEVLHKRCFVVLSFKSPNDIPSSRVQSININRKLDFLTFYDMGILDETYMHVHVHNGEMARTLASINLLITGQRLSPFISIY